MARTIGRSPEEVLGLRPGASADEIKSAYRNLARRYHPDVSSDPDAEEKFKELGGLIPIYREG